eukprot:gene20184-2254_t
MPRRSRAGADVRYYVASKRSRTQAVVIIRMWGEVGARCGERRAQRNVVKWCDRQGLAIGDVPTVDTATIVAAIKSGLICVPRGMVDYPNTDGWVGCIDRCRRGMIHTTDGWITKVEDGDAEAEEAAALRDLMRHPRGREGGDDGRAAQRPRIEGGGDKPEGNSQDAPPAEC